MNFRFKPSGLIPHTNTNYLFSIKASKPGIWRAVVNHVDQKDFCTISIRSTRSDAPAIGFNTDTDIDSGKHSQESTATPDASAKNAIIASSKTDSLRYAHIYINERGFEELVFTSPLILRAEGCNWEYITSTLFQCPAAFFTVAVEGSDPAGHQFRRLYKTHCNNYDKPASVNAENGKSPVLTSFHFSTNLF